MKIFETLGTPTLEKWPKLGECPDWKPNFPIYPSIDLTQILPKLEGVGIDLLLKMLEYSPDKRISADSALLHSFLNN